MTAWASPCTKACTCPGSQRGVDRFDERRVVAGSLLANQIGSATAENPIDLHACRRGQRDFVLGPGGFDEDLPIALAGNASSATLIAGSAVSSPTNKCQSAAGSGA